jgi:hypothetical protein
MGRQQAYSLVQRNALRSLEGHGTFQDNLTADPEIIEHLNAEAVALCFDLRHALREVDYDINGALDEKARTRQAALPMSRSTGARDTPTNRSIPPHRPRTGCPAQSGRSHVPSTSFDSA